MLSALATASKGDDGARVNAAVKHPLPPKLNLCYSMKALALRMSSSKVATLLLPEVTRQHLLHMLCVIPTVSLLSPHPCSKGAQGVVLGLPDPNTWQELP